MLNGMSMNSPRKGKEKEERKRKENSLTKREDHRVCMNTPRFDKEELRTWRKTKKKGIL